MAIQLNLTDSYGIIHDKAYAKITSFNLVNAGVNTAMTYQVSAWTRKEAKDAGYKPFDNDRYEVVTSELASPDLAGAYSHLMTQDKYKDGVSV